MDTIIARLQTMTEDQLRESILGAGLKCGPITSTTRTTWQKKLARALMQKDNSLANERSTGLSCDRGEEEAYDQSLKLNQSVEEAEGESSRALCKEGEEEPTESTVVYYGVCPQREEDPLAKDEKVHVFVGRKTALKVMGAMPGARFKAFSTREEAETFSKGMNTLESGTSSTSLEKANEFPSPRIQDLTSKLRIAVEEGDQKTFMKLVWDNPRYLIGSGDNPTIVQTGCHYNSLHVAAKENQPGIVHVLLDTLENPVFMRRMYPDDQETILQQRISYIVDLYLNTPDKTNNDTPLHFACKFGCPEVVNVLCSHSTTDKQRRNKYSKMPCDVICDRKNKRSTATVRKQIQEYLEDRCYLHLLRATDNSVQPVFRFPCSPSQLKEDFHPLDNELEGSPIDPVLALRAYVGPLSPSKAEAFYKLWKNSHRNTAENPAKDFHTILKTDPDRGMECVGREIAHEMGHPWAEHWDFLDSFVDLSNEEGLNRLEDYLEEKDSSIAHQTTREVNLLTGKKHESSSTTGNDSVSPVCNLLQQFEKADLLDGSNSLDDQEKAGHVEGQLATCVPGSEREGLDLASVSFWTAWGMSQTKQKKKEDDLSSTSSEEYLTADEDSVDDSREDERDRKKSDSSYSSCQSIEDTGEYTPLKPQPSTSQTLFIEGDFPTKLDNEVLSAIENVKINAERYPFITKWRNIVQAYPSTHRLSWPSPIQKKHLMQKKDFTSQRINSPWHPRSLSSPSGSGSPN